MNYIKKYILFGVIAGVVLLTLHFVFMDKEKADKTEHNLPEEAATVFEQDERPEFKKEYDVIVTGGSPEGVAAAVAAARNGMDTLLIEQRDGLGGLMIYGMLNFLDVSSDKNGDPANQGIFKEWHQLVDNKIGFDIDKGQQAFRELVMQEENLTLSLNTKLEEAIVEEDQLTGIKISVDSEQYTINAARFIDSTDDADLAVMAGAPYFIGGADIGLENRKMAVTPMIHLEGVDWEELGEAAEADVFGGGTVTPNVAWGFSELHCAYEPVERDTRLRGLNMVRQSDGSVVINALQIFGVDGLDPESVKKGMEKGQKQTRHVVEFLSKEIPGFENAEIASFPEELYIRETRHIKAEYQLPMADVWKNQDHWDSIGFGAYPVDVQATSVNDYGYVLSKPVQYAIPFRSLVPKKIEHLLVASKASGYSSLAAGSARVLPVGMTAGQAAGTASAVSINQKKGFDQMIEEKEPISTVQKKLVGQGANLYEFDIAHPYEDKWYGSAITTLMNYGIIIAGYDNKLTVEEDMNELTFSNLINSGVKRARPHMPAEIKDKLAQFNTYSFNKEEGMTRDKAAKILFLFNDEKVPESNVWERAYQTGLIDKEIYNRIEKNRILKVKEGYYLTAQIIETAK